MKMKKFTKYFKWLSGIGILSCSGMFIVPLITIAFLSGAQAISSMNIMIVGSMTQGANITGNAFLDSVLSLWIMIGMPPSGPIILIASMVLAVLSFHKNKFSLALLLAGGILFYLGMYVANALVLAIISSIVILLSYLSTRMKLFA